MIPVSETSKEYSQRRKVICQFDRTVMQPIKKLEQTRLSQKWKFKCPTCEIEFVEWV